MAEQTLNEVQSNSTDVQDDQTIVLSIKDLRKYFPVEGGFFIKRKIADVKAVDGVSFDLKKGETLGVVGNLVVVSPLSQRQLLF